MVSVSQDHVLQVSPVPPGKIEMVVIFRLFLYPHIEGFIHDDEAHPVAQVEKFGSGRIVRCPDAVTAHGFQDLKLPLQGTDVYRGAKTPQVMVITHAEDFHRLAVEGEPFRDVECERADAETPSLPCHRHGSPAQWSKQHL